MSGQKYLVLHEKGWKRIVAIAVFGIFVMFAGFSFWCHPQADDFIGAVLNRKYDFRGFQSYVYQTNSGRYVASFLADFFFRNGFLFRHYYLSPLLFIAGTIAALCYLLKTIAYTLSFQKIPFLQLLFAAFCIGVVVLSVMPEPVSAFFWFSGAATYQTGNILFLVFLSQLLRTAPPGRKQLWNKEVLLLMVITVLLCGCNEPVALLAFCCTLIIISPLLFKSGYPPLFVGVLSGVFILAIIILLGAPGVRNRAGALHFNFFHILKAGAYTIYWMARALWYLFKTPLFWFFELGVFIFAGSIGSNTALWQWFKKVSVARLFWSLLLVNIVALYPVLFASNGSFPYRALNTVVFVNFILLSFFTGRVGVEYPGIVKLSFYEHIRYPVFFLLIFCNGFMTGLLQTALSGYFYNSVMKQQETALQRAATTGVRQLNMDSYEQERVTVRQLLLQQPEFLYFKPLEDDKTYQYMLEYYHMDTLREGNRLYYK
ncbi:hypothetical protein A8C56_07935 [Niabella ginsenosidivorans]|uniref:Uncharacterized protein n=1 Tax=Niabella ginsenosidivorans TaxID=1176587 RepID=A0A1A9I1J1_9BACT|nr:DUF6056 family protein [Niabella ginsenosidivorans]ANH80919.1 hypothetical protein A8C56_07935 [Niabella ginsenosidivorans]